MRSCNHALGEKMAGRFGWAVSEWFKYKNKLGNRMIKQLSNSVIAKYCDLSMSRRSIICLSLRLRQIIDLLATDKSQYFAQPRPIIVNYSPPTEWIMRKPNKNKMAGINSRFASVSESIFNGFLLKMLLRSLPVYILKQLFFSISVNSGRIFSSPLPGSVNILPLFTSISKNNC